MSEYTTPDGNTVDITFASALNDLRVSLEAVASRVRGETPADETFPPRTSSRAVGKKSGDAVALPDGTFIDAAQIVQELARIVRDIAEAPSAAPKKAARKTKAKGGGGKPSEADCDALVPLAGNQDGDVAFGVEPDPGDGGQARFAETTFGGGGDGIYGVETTPEMTGGYVILPQQGGYELQQPPIYVPAPQPQPQPQPPQQGGGQQRAVQNNNTGGSVRVVHIPEKYGGVMPDPIPPRSVGF